MQKNGLGWHKFIKRATQYFRPWRGWWGPRASKSWRATDPSSGWKSSGDAARTFHSGIRARGGSSSTRCSSTRSPAQKVGTFLINIPIPCNQTTFAHGKMAWQDGIGGSFITRRSRPDHEILWLAAFLPYHLIPERRKTFDVAVTTRIQNYGLFRHF